jgi:hypothetical protein
LLLLLILLVVAPALLPQLDASHAVATTRRAGAEFDGRAVGRRSQERAAAADHRAIAAFTIQE